MPRANSVADLAERLKRIEDQVDPSTVRTGVRTTKRRNTKKFNPKDFSLGFQTQHFNWKLLEKTALELSQEASSIMFRAQRVIERLEADPRGSRPTVGLRIIGSVNTLIKKTRAITNKLPKP